MTPKLLFFLSLQLIACIAIYPQNKPNQLTAKWINEPVKVDGKLDENVWQHAEHASQFAQYFPSDSVAAKSQTWVKVLYSDAMIYVGIRAETVSNKYVTSSLKRDFSGLSNDNVSVVFDTYNDATNAFIFGATPLGVQRELFVSNGGSTVESFNATWDVKWFSANQNFPDHYTLEFAIPLSSLKFKEGTQKWRFQVFRWDLQTNEQSAWSKVPKNQLLSNLGYLGDLHFEKPLGKSNTPLAIIPYVNTFSSKNFTTDKTDNRLKVGGDAKVAIGNGMNLDVTVNPDFSNVEVDNVITNLTRFEVSLPEKRQFFIDNNDLFGNFGSMFQDANPFFSRRIGIAYDKNGNSIENQILGGVRLSGKMDENWRLGLLNVQTAEDLSNHIASNNNMMATIQRKIFARSNMSAFMINRQSFKDYDFLADNDVYNRVIGVDFNLASANNNWTGKAYLHKSFQPNDTKGNLSAQAALVYNTRTYNFISDWVYVDKDFRSDLGFIPRTDIFKVGNGFGRSFYPQKGIINRNTMRLVSVFFFKPTSDYKKIDREYWLWSDLDFKDQSTLTLRLVNNYTFLSFAFDPTRTIGATLLPKDSEYTTTYLYSLYQSNRRKMVTFTGNSIVGQFFNGTRASVGGELALRFQPKASVSVAFNYDRLRLPSPYSDADIWLISPKFDITFTKSLFWSTLIQYSNQRADLGINSRLQWRFAPLSDLYLVYNDGYSTNDFLPKTRSINLKLTYWLNK